MNPALIPMATLAASFLTLFGSAEWMYRKEWLQVEWSRKYVHIVTGLITLLFPIVLTSHWQVLLLCLSFGVILVISKKLSLLQSINGISRASQGSILYPLAVYLSYLIFEEKGELIWFYAPILTMAICDPMAAFVGKKKPWSPYKVGQDTKTMSGSLGFVVSAFVLLLGLFFFLNVTLIVPFAVAAILIAIIAAFTEAISQHGSDNIWIPIVVLISLQVLVG